MIKVTITNEKGISFLPKLVPQLNTALQKGVFEAGEAIRANIVKTLRDTSKRYTGGLANSYHVTIISSAKGAVKVGVLSDAPHASIQDRGGTITPKGHPFLAIPQTQKARVRWPRDWEKHEGLYAIFGSVGGVLKERVPGKTDILQYVLTKAVTIKGKGYLEKAKSKSKKEVEQILGKNIEVAVKTVEAKSK